VKCGECPNQAFLPVTVDVILFEVKARYVVGLKATPQRRDGHQPIIHIQTGPVRFKADPRSQLAQCPQFINELQGHRVQIVSNVSPGSCRGHPFTTFVTSLTPRTQ